MFMFFSYAFIIIIVNLLEKLGSSSVGIFVSTNKKTSNFEKILECGSLTHQESVTKILTVQCIQTIN